LVGGCGDLAGSRGLRLRAIAIAATARWHSSRFPAPRWQASRRRPPPTTPTTYAGQAHALDADVAGIVEAHVGPISGTGQLPPAGGMLDASLVSLSTPYPLATQAGARG